MTVKSKISIMSWNARSLFKVNKDLVIDYCIKINIDVFCIQETYLKPYINPSFRDFKMLRLDRWNKERGGVIIGINKEINYNTEIKLKLLDVNYILKIK